MALADDDKERIVDVHRRMGFRTEKDDKEVSYDLSRLAFDRDDRESTRGMNIQQYFEHIGACGRKVGPRISSHYESYKLAHALKLAV